MAQPDWKINTKAIDQTLWIRGFMADRQAEADYLGMDLLDYMAESHGGILRDVIAKVKLHAETHPKFCPPDCAFKASLERLGKKYRKQKPDA